jgi:bacterioferritin-associated ferredoxin
MSESVNDNIIVCRCEDITLNDIRKAIADGFVTIDDIKRATRAGMGPCQGRTCRPLIASEVAWHSKIPMDEVMMPTFRPPLKPVKLGSFVKCDCSDIEESAVKVGDES